MSSIETFIHPFFGALVYEPSIQWYVGTIHYHDAPLKVNFALENLTKESPLFYSAENVLVYDHFVALLMKSMASLLEIKNRDWLNEDEAPFTLEELFDFISIDAIVFYNDQLELYSYESDIFWGNRAVICANYQGELINTYIEEELMDEE